MIHILKGYHHAQMGWITTSWEGRKEVPDKHPNADQELAVLLVLYLPRFALNFLNQFDSGRTTDEHRGRGEMGQGGDRGGG